ncbi:YgcG family protein [Acidaminococcus timonensis]|uniref:TPM domain-containing protein n=1 Tax=Acidaminococcus timonensis TaxID=1871002 RepID=UPI0026ED649D|nr:TPM domain-containing protein [Acidaminococcus timonensis]
MKRLLLLLVVFCQLLAAPLGAGAQAKVPPRPTTSIYVQDQAGVLSKNTRAAINAYSTALQKKTKAQIVVLTVPTLQGQSLEDYSLTVLRSWGIGDKEKNNGVLLLVAVKDRKSRIEVGYGLEGALPDGLTGRIQDQYMLPYFRNNDYDKGILNAYSALLQTVLKEYNLTTKDLDVQGVQPAPQQADDSISPFALGLGAIGLLLLFLLDRIFLGGALFRFLLYSFFFRGGGRGGGGFGGGGFGGGSFGGGSGGGGGSSRSW